MGSHLRPTFVVVEGHKEVGRGEDPVASKIRLSAKVTSRLTRSVGRIVTTSHTDWGFGKLPLTQRLGEGVVGHPCLVDEGGSVEVQVMDSAVKAERLHAAGMRRLFTLANPSLIRWMVSHFGGPEKLVLGASRYGSVPELLEDAWLEASDRLLRTATDPVRVRDGQEFQRVTEVVRADCPAATAAVIGTAARTLAAQAVVGRRLITLSEGGEARVDTTEQLANLTFKRFISVTLDPWFGRIPVWIEACGTRLVTRGRNPARDERNHSEIMELEARYDQLYEAQPSRPLPADVKEIVFLLGELWISLFAQGARTLVPVSAKRIPQAMGRIGR